MLFNIILFKAVCTSLLVYTCILFLNERSDYFYSSLYCVTDLFLCLSDDSNNMSSQAKKEKRRPPGTVEYTVSTGCLRNASLPPPSDTTTPT